MKSVLEDIKNQEYKQAYLFFGEEGYLKKQYRNKLLQAWNPDGDTMNESRFEGKGIDVKEVISLGETMPFFSDRRIILLENTGFFKKANHGLTPLTSLSVEVVQGKMRPPEEKGKAGSQAILAAKTVRRNLFLPLAGGGAQHRRVVIHAAGCLPSVGSAASSPQGEEPAKCRNYSPTLTTALETPWILPSRKSWTSSSPSSWLMSGATFILPDSSRLMASLKVSGLMKEP